MFSGQVALDWDVKRSEVDPLPAGEIHSHWGGCACGKVNTCTLALIVNMGGPPT